jgi:hypothetical protein
MVYLNQHSVLHRIEHTAVAERTVSDTQYRSHKLLFNLEYHTSTVCSMLSMCDHMQHHVHASSSKYSISCPHHLDALLLYIHSIMHHTQCYYMYIHSIYSIYRLYYNLGCRHHLRLVLHVCKLQCYEPPGITFICTQCVHVYVCLYACNSSRVQYALAADTLLPHSRSTQYERCAEMLLCNRC